MWEDVVAGGELEGLREIRTPEPVPYTPQTTAWYVVFAVVALALLVAAYRWWRLWQRNAYRRQALEDLAGLRASSSLSELPVLLKHTALEAWPRVDVAALTGEAWLNFLDTSYAGGGFADGPGQVLPTLAYERGVLAPDEANALWDLSERWIRSHRA